jgi:hypothetical protein
MGKKVQVEAAEMDCLFRELLSGTAVASGKYSYQHSSKEVTNG